MPAIKTKFKLKFYCLDEYDRACDQLAKALQPHSEDEDEAFDNAVAAFAKVGVKKDDFIEVEFDLVAGTAVVVGAKSKKLPGRPKSGLKMLTGDFDD